MKKYQAPWSTALVLISTVTTLLCVGISAAMIATGPASVRWAALFPIAIVFGAAPFAIRAYSVTPNAVLVHRLFWTTRLPLTGLREARIDFGAMSRSIRLCGNGGLFSFTGLFRNQRLGTYRAFVTDPSRAVVLEFPARNVVLSPSDPEDFVREVIQQSRSAPELTA